MRMYLLKKLNSVIYDQLWYQKIGPKFLIILYRPKHLKLRDLKDTLCNSPRAEKKSCKYIFFLIYNHSIHVENIHLLKFDKKLLLNKKN